MKKMNIENLDVISLDLDGKNPKIISMGHRNPQGLFYDEKNKKLKFFCNIKFL